MTSKEQELLKFLDEILTGTADPLLDEEDYRVLEKEEGAGEDPRPSHKEAFSEEEAESPPEAHQLTMTQTHLLEEKVVAVEGSLTEASFNALLKVKSKKPSISQLKVKSKKPSISQIKAIADYVSILPENTPDAVAIKCQAIKRVLQAHRAVRAAIELSERYAADKSTNIIAWYVSQGNETERRKAVRQVLASQCSKTIEAIIDPVKRYVADAEPAERREAVCQILASRCRKAIKAIVEEVKWYVNNTKPEEELEVLRQLLTAQASEVMQICRDKLTTIIARKSPAEIRQDKQVIDAYINAKTKPHGKHVPFIVCVLKSRIEFAIKKQVVGKLRISESQLKGLNLRDLHLRSLITFVKNGYSNAVGKSRRVQKKRQQPAASTEEGDAPISGKRRRGAAPSTTSTGDSVATPFREASAGMGSSLHHVTSGP